MINSGPRRPKYRAGLNHTVDDDCVGHCQGHWHFACHRVLVFASLVKKNSFDRNLPLSKQVFQHCLGRATGVVIVSTSSSRSNRFCRGFKRRGRGFEPAREAGSVLVRQGRDFELDLGPACFRNP